VTEQPISPRRGADLAESAHPAELIDAEREEAVPQPPRRQPGEPHPYMLQRNPPNLWILVALTIFSLALTVLILTLTVLL
jgi:hypothetical protein